MQTGQPPGPERSGEGKGSTNLREELVDCYLEGVRGLWRQGLDFNSSSTVKADAYYCNLLTEVILSQSKSGILTTREALLTGAAEPKVKIGILRHSRDGSLVKGPDGYYAFEQFLGLPVSPVAAFYERQGGMEKRDLLFNHRGPGISIPYKDRIYVMRHFAYDFWKQTGEQNPDTNAENALWLLRASILRLPA